jgi:hypothetical protein
MIDGTALMRAKQHARYGTRRSPAQQKGSTVQLSLSSCRPLRVTRRLQQHIEKRTIRGSLCGIDATGGSVDLCMVDI